MGTVGWLHCAECSGTFVELFEDPRDPPLDIGYCLCRNCRNNAIHDKIEELEEEIDKLKVELEN